MKSLIFTLLFCSISFASIPQETGYGAYLGLNGGTLGMNLRQPVGNEAIDLYIDLFILTGNLNIAGQYFFMEHDIFPIKTGKLVIQYGPGASIYLDDDRLNLSFLPGCGLNYTFIDPKWDMFFNVNLAMGVTFYDDNSRENRVDKRSSRLNIIPAQAALLGFRYRF